MLHEGSVMGNYEAWHQFGEIHQMMSRSGIGIRGNHRMAVKVCLISVMCNPKTKPLMHGGGVWKVSLEMEIPPPPLVRSGPGSGPQPARPARPKGNLKKLQNLD